jgi:hypothetical protein
MGDWIARQRGNSDGKKKGDPHGEKVTADRHTLTRTACSLGEGEGKDNSSRETPRKHDDKHVQPDYYASSSMLASSRMDRMRDNPEGISSCFAFTSIFIENSRFSVLFMPNENCVLNAAVMDASKPFTLPEPEALALRPTAKFTAVWDTEVSLALNSIVHSSICTEQCKYHDNRDLQVITATVIADLDEWDRDDGQQRHCKRVRVLFA